MLKPIDSHIKFEIEDFKIYYAKKPTFFEKDEPKDLADFRERWAYIKTVQAYGLEDVFRMMQAENWSPRGEARDLIRKAGVNHTSMSVGDIVETEDGLYYIVADVGFHVVEMGK